MLSQAMKGARINLESSSDFSMRNDLRPIIHNQTRLSRKMRMICGYMITQDELMDASEH